MLRMTLWHEPNHFQFYIQDRYKGAGINRRLGEELLSRDFAVGKGIVLVAVKSEFAQIPIAVEFDQNPLEILNFEDWDKIVECSIDVVSGELVFVGCASDPVRESFGLLEVSPGVYRLRIFFGGQDSVGSSGAATDHYLVQVWPSTDVVETVVKS